MSVEFLPPSRPVNVSWITVAVWAEQTGWYLYGDRVKKEEGSDRGSCTLGKKAEGNSSTVTITNKQHKIQRIFQMYRRFKSKPIILVSWRGNPPFYCFFPEQFSQKWKEVIIKLLVINHLAVNLVDVTWPRGDEDKDNESGGDAGASLFFLLLKIQWTEMEETRGAVLSVFLPARIRASVLHIEPDGKCKLVPVFQPLVFLWGTSLIPAPAPVTQRRATQFWPC